MDKQKAVQILSQALGQIPTTRDNHQLFLQALNVLTTPEMKPPVQEKAVKEEKSGS